MSATIQDLRDRLANATDPIVRDALVNEIERVERVERKKTKTETAIEAYTQDRDEHGNR